MGRSDGVRSFGPGATETWTALPGAAFKGLIAA
jgi:hypothetical protein